VIKFVIEAWPLFLAIGVSLLYGALYGGGEWPEE
jgi:hypothetical protein